MSDDKKPETAPVVEVKVPERKSAKKPVIAPDGHVNLSQEDIDNRA